MECFFGFIKRNWGSAFFGASSHRPNPDVTETSPSLSIANTSIDEPLDSPRRDLDYVIVCVPKMRRDA
jgi:hypothetical protein